eukprot:CAMPEP_0185760834 /NCGR_PEP_ID=MMETSP1174-20130828/19749_1 /TAXON_ID=35687 /ORGANISM="Dictyocha speculum, Strain CCMP1381" /LENGTH=236 /DNA_ID=CAMNT_0028441811 /DNA_START=183 /DNA_END=894 /DNA_ORIENTATION=+
MAQVVFDKQGVASMSGKTWLKRNSKPLWEGVRHVRLSLLKALKAAYSSDDPDVRSLVVAVYSGLPDREDEEDPTLEEVQLMKSRETVTELHEPFMQLMKIVLVRTSGLNHTMDNSDFSKVCGEAAETFAKVAFLYILEGGAPYLNSTTPGCGFEESFREMYAAAAPYDLKDRDENPQANLAFQPLADEDSEDDFFTQRFRRTSSGRVGGVSSDTESDSDDEPPRQRRRTVLEEDDE